MEMHETGGRGSTIRIAAAVPGCCERVAVVVFVVVLVAVLVGVVVVGVGACFRFRVVELERGKSFGMGVSFVSGTVLGSTGGLGVVIVLVGSGWLWFGSTFLSLSFVLLEVSLLVGWKDGLDANGSLFLLMLVSI